MEAPRKLSTIPVSPHFDKAVARKIDKVFVDGIHIPRCVAYDMDAGWAFNLGQWGVATESARCGYRQTKRRLLNHHHPINNQREIVT